jgi:hypothetical protein
MTNKELFYFTGKCLALDDHPEFAEEIIHMSQSEAINWGAFVKLCSSHLILPAIYLKFLSYGIINHLPQELAEFLKDIYDLNLERNKKIIDQLQSLTQTLNAHEIYPIFLKGTAHLLDHLYSDQGERMIGDIDFLVGEKDYLRAVAILKNDGYATDSPVYVDVETLKHYPCLSKPGEVTHIEIHRIPVAKDYSSWFNSEIINQEKKQVSALCGCFVLSDKHKVIHNFIHAQLGHKGHLNGIVSFRDLYDVYLLSQRSEIKQALDNIKSKSKAIAYFVFTQKAFSLKEEIYPEANLSSHLFLKKHDLNISSRVFYHTYRYTVYFGQRILIGYVGQAVKSFYSKKTRKSVLRRLTNRGWYKAHFDSYRAFFSPQK